MTAQISAYGRLGQAPRAIETRSGKAMAVASLAVAVGDDADAPPLWLGLVAFDRVAEDLLRHDKGELLSASGRLQRRNWTAQDGTEHEQLQIVVDVIVSARTVRPSGGRKRTKGNGQEKVEPATRNEVPDDPLPF